MDFVFVILFLVLYYIRPQEWIGGVNALRPITVVMAMAIAAMLMRYRGFRIRDFFRTSHDWLMLAYFVWIVVSSPPYGETFGETYTLFLFYVVTVQTLSNVGRIQSFLNWWTILILCVAALAVASEFGFDPMHSNDLTNGAMRGRLVLNTSIFNNPNALGHGVYPVVLMLYFTLFWNRPVFIKVFSLPIIALPLYCIYLTASKGAFLAGFVTMVCALAFKRSKTTQILILLLALTGGWAALSSLPRMEQLESPKGDRAVQGRVAAFQYGLSSLREHPMGIGYERFSAGFFKANKYKKASHSTYVQVGTELGFPGLFLFLAILYNCLRTLLIVRTADTREKRVQRMLFVLLASYLVSGWMVNFTYRATFFLMAGAIAAFHRQLFEKTHPRRETDSAMDMVAEAPPGGGLPALEPVMANPALALSALDQSTVAAPPAGTATDAIDVQAEVEPVGVHWSQFRWFDWGIVLVLLYATVQFWTFIMHYM